MIQKNSRNWYQVIPTAHSHINNPVYKQFSTPMVTEHDTARFSDINTAVHTCVTRTLLTEW
jgi:hypothetical protein